LFKKNGGSVQSPKGRFQITSLLMKQPLRTAFHAVALSLAALAASAAPGDSNSPVGAWRTIDDKAGKTRSIVEAYEFIGFSVFGRTQTWEREQ
jgi:hypothetical protein